MNKPRIAAHNKWLTVELVPVRERETNETGALLVTMDAEQPVVDISGREMASEAINGVYKQRIEALEIVKAQLKAYAMANYISRPEDERKGWPGYSLGTSYEVPRADSRVVSLLETYYEYAGGAHPASNKTAAVFDTQTGKRLVFSDVVTDEEEARAWINGYLGEVMQEPSYQAVLFEDYKEHIDEIVTADTWYLSEQGVGIIANTYIVAPYAAGILTFTIPYEKFPLLKEDYRPI